MGPVPLARVLLDKRMRAVRIREVRLVRIRFSGHLGALTREAECHLRVDTQLSCDQLMLVLAQLYPALGPFLREQGAAVIVNGRRLATAHLVSDTDEVELREQEIGGDRVAIH